jgi:hypothetical protein
MLAKQLYFIITYLCCKHLCLKLYIMHWLKILNVRLVSNAFLKWVRLVSQVFTWARSFASKYKNWLKINPKFILLMFAVLYWAVPDNPTSGLRHRAGRMWQLELGQVPMRAPTQRERFHWSRFVCQTQIGVKLGYKRSSLSQRGRRPLGRVATRVAA